MIHDFSGTGVALVTPFEQDGSVDYPALEKLVNKVIAGGVNYLVALGTTAETPTLSKEEKDAVLRFVLDKAAGRVPVVCGAGSNSTAEAIAMMQAWESLPIAGWLSVVPYYNKPTQGGMLAHFDAIAGSTGKPVILYNVPGRTVANMAPQTVLTLASRHANIVAIKEASGSLPQCMEIVAGKPDGFQVLSGDDNLILAQMAVGMDGVISVAANCWPQTFSKSVKAALDGSFSEARELFYPMLPGIDLLFAEGNPTGVKAVLTQQGVMQNELRLPLISASEALEEKLGAFTAIA